MRDRGATHGKLAKEGLHIADLRVTLRTGRGIAHMADAQFAGQRVHHILIGELVAHQTKAAGRMETFNRLIGDDAARFLAPVLKCVKPKCHKVGSFSHAGDAKDPAFFAKFIVVERIGCQRAHRLGVRHPETRLPAALAS